MRRIKSIGCRRLQSISSAAAPRRHYRRAGGKGFAFDGDPIKLGLVASLNRPGGNLTGSCVLAPTRRQLEDSDLGADLTGRAKRHHFECRARNSSTALLNT
jgi:hypothetical protein